MGLEVDLQNTKDSVEFFSWFQGCGGHDDQPARGEEAQVMAQQLGHGQEQEPQLQQQQQLHRVHETEPAAVVATMLAADILEEYRYCCQTKAIFEFKHKQLYICVLR